MIATTGNAIDLTSLKAVKDFVEVKTANDDAIIAGLITSFSQWCLTYCSRETLNRVLGFTELYDGNGSSRLYTRNSPIQSLVSVMVDGIAFPISLGYGKAGVFIEQTGRSIGIRGGSSGSFQSTYYPAAFGSRSIFCKGQGNVQIQYTAGYLPTDIENDIITIAAQTIILSEAPWSVDNGVVFYPSLVPLTLVPNSPITGQYSVADGLYTFSSADNGKQVSVNYSVNKAPYDLEFAARRSVGVFYKRRQWLDQSSKSLGATGSSGSTRYRDWPITPEDRITLNSYKRNALT